MLDFGSPHFFIHFGYDLLSELRSYEFLCRLAVKFYFLNKILHIFKHFWNLTQFYRFRRPSWILAAILNIFIVIMDKDASLVSIGLSIYISLLHTIAILDVILFVCSCPRMLVWHSSVL